MTFLCLGCIAYLFESSWLFSAGADIGHTVRDFLLLCPYKGLRVTGPGSTVQDFFGHKSNGMGLCGTVDSNQFGAREKSLPWPDPSKCVEPAELLSSWTDCKKDTSSGTYSRKVTSSLAYYELTEEKSRALEHIVEESQALEHILEKSRALGHITN